MNILLEIPLFIILFLFTWIKGILFFFKSLLFPYKKDVSGDVVVITGAGSGLGQLMCLRFAELGSTVVGWDISESGLETTKRLVEEKTGKEMHTYICDVSIPDAIYRTVKRTRDDLDAPISIFVNNAGIVSAKLLLDLSDALLEKVFKVNTLSHFWSSKAVLPEMMERKKGHLVFIASCAGMFGARQLTDYCSSKAADMIFAESLSNELYFGGHPEIKVTCVCPWVIATGMFAGFQSNFTGILPQLDPTETVDTIMAAILREQNLVAIPRMMYLMNFCKSFLPTQANRELFKALGAETFMNTFTGRSMKVD